MDAAALTGGWGNAPVEAARAFRGAMSAMARPGKIEVLAGAVPPAPLSVAAGTLILTLCDAETPVHLAGAWDVPAVRDWITFHTGAPFADPERAMFAVGSWEALGALHRYPIGVAEYPDRSATLIVEMERLVPSGAVLRGPGIKDSAALNLPELHAFQENAMAFPLGLDFFFAAGDRVAALPRTTRVSPSDGAAMEDA